MNARTKRIIIIIITSVVVLVGALVIIMQDAAPTQPQQANSSPTPSAAATPPPNSSEELPAQQAAGAYVDYVAADLATTPGTKLLFFHAPWCPQCRSLEADIKNDGVPAGVTIFKVDYDTNQDLRKKYGVTIQTTVVRVTDAGELAEKFVPYDEPTLDNVVENLL